MSRLLLVLLAAACQPAIGPSLSLITAPRLIAVRGEPPEAAPGASVAFDALVADPAGAVTPALDWSLCLVPRPESDNVVADPCLGAGTEPLARAPAVTVALPGDGCQRFGPEPPPEAPGQPALRPRDPDASGGYYQPLRIDLVTRLVTGLVTGLDTQPSIALERITCDLAGASLDVATAFAARYRANRNPQLTPLGAAVDGAAVPLDELPAGRTITFTAGWSDSAETYPVLDRVSGALADQREALRVSWFASAGAFTDEHTGRSADDPSTTTANMWRAPDEPGVVHLWIVLRDDRGGVDFAAADVTIVNR